MSARSNRRAKAPAWARIILVLAAAALLAVTCLGAMNLSALHSYNEATQTLENNIHAAADDDADLQSLALSQQQVDMQFASASAMKNVLLPGLKGSVERNAAVSRQLTDMIDKALNAGSSSTSQDGQAGGQSSSTATQSLTEEQRQQIEEMLKANGTQTSASPSTSAGGASTSTSQSTAKPW